MPPTAKIMPSAPGLKPSAYDEPHVEGAHDGLENRLHRRAYREHEQPRVGSDESRARGYLHEHLTALVVSLRRALRVPRLCAGSRVMQETTAHRSQSRTVRWTTAPASERARPAHLGHRRQRGQLAVGFENVIAADEGRKIRVVRDSEDRVEHGRDEHNGIELRYREQVRDGSQPDGKQNRRDCEVRNNHNGPAVTTIDPHTR
jgi:hypothetical protein